MVTIGQNFHTSNQGYIDIVFLKCWRTDLYSSWIDVRDARKRHALFPQKGLPWSKISNTAPPTVTVGQIHKWQKDNNVTIMKEKMAIVRYAVMNKQCAA